MQWGGCFGDSKHQTILTQILVGIHSGWVYFCVQLYVISKKKVFAQIESVFLSKFRVYPKKAKLKPSLQAETQSSGRMWYFAYFSVQWGSPPSPIPLATLLTFSIPHFLNDVKRSWDCWWVYFHVNSKNRFQNYLKVNKSKNTLLF